MYPGGEQLLLTLLLGVGVVWAGSTLDPYSEYEARLNQFVTNTINRPACDLYTDLLRKAS
jgi:hypothetical protein